jgi:exportin-2 (importin alpha re-exporter)
LERVSCLDDAYMYSLLLPSANLANRSTEKDAEEDAPLLADPVKAQLREQLVPAMVALSAPADKPVRAQLAETVSVIAAMDFPDLWPDLIDVSDLPNLISSH